MKQELKVYKFTCYMCHVSIIITGRPGEKPPGWEVTQVGPCGMTNYFKDEEVCKDCYDSLKLVHL